MRELHYHQLQFVARLLPEKVLLLLRLPLLLRLHRLSVELVLQDSSLRFPEKRFLHCQQGLRCQLGVLLQFPLLVLLFLQRLGQLALLLQERRRLLLLVF